MKLAYRDYGAGQPLVILHGLFGQSDNWNSLARQFSEHGFHVFAVDQRNHGLSPHSEEMNFGAMAEDLSGFLKEHHLDQPILLGHSMGGKTVLRFELDFPGVAAKLIVADIAARHYPPHHQDVLEALHSVNLETIKTRREAEEILSKRISDFGTKQFLLKNLYWKKDQLLAWRFNLSVIGEQYRRITEAIPFYRSASPMLVVRGEKSKYVQEDDISDFKNRFSNCVVTTIKGAGHWVHAEKPQAFLETVLAFIKS